MDSKVLESAIASAGIKVLERLIIYLVIWSILFLAFSLIYNSSGIGRNSTDGKERSNLRLHTDHKTGCQYLSAANGGLTPRLNYDGSHRCFK